jgi:tetratricopeptide (TPR) repeat protein
MILRTGALAVVLGLCLLSEASAQFILGPPPPGPSYGMSGWRYKSVVIVVGTPPSSQPRITINNNYYGGASSPILGTGYDQDTRGYDLDQIPIKKAQPSEPADESSRPLPGVNVSKSKPTVRPGDLPEKPAVKGPPPELPLPPQPLADPQAESTRLVELGMGAFQAGAYGLAAQRFGQATQVTPALAHTFFLLAQAEFALGKYRDAIDTIHAGMKIDKQWPRTAFQPRLELYKGRDAEYAEHMKHVTDAAAAAPNNATLLFLVAHQVWFDGQRKDALALFQRARPLAEAADRVYFDAFIAAGGPGAIAKA